MYPVSHPHLSANLEYQEGPLHQDGTEPICMVSFNGMPVVDPARNSDEAPLPHPGSTIGGDLRLQAQPLSVQDVRHPLNSPWSVATEEPANPPTVPESGPRCKQCGHAGPDRAHWFCDQCRCTLCDVHWDFQVLHNDANLEVGQLRHSKVDKDLDYLIRNCVRPQWKREDLDDIHGRDSRTTWFCVVHEINEDGEPSKKLCNLERFEQLMFNWEPNVRPNLCPSIVSFIGESGQ